MDLPHSCVELILGALEGRDAASARMVCRHWAAQPVRRLTGTVRTALGVGSLIRQLTSPRCWQLEQLELTLHLTARGVFLALAAALPTSLRHVSLTVHEEEAEVVDETEALQAAGMATTFFVGLPELRSLGLSGPLLCSSNLTALVAGLPRLSALVVEDVDSQAEISLLPASPCRLSHLGLELPNATLRVDWSKLTHLSKLFLNIAHLLPEGPVPAPPTLLSLKVREVLALDDAFLEAVALLPLLEVCLESADEGPPTGRRAVSELLRGSVNTLVELWLTDSYCQTSAADRQLLKQMHQLRYLQFATIEDFAIDLQQHTPVFLSLACALGGPGRCEVTFVTDPIFPGHFDI